jgi:thiamine biosynthesis protein ThiS
MELPEGTTVAQLIDRLGLSDAICAAEIDRELVPRRDRGEREILDGQRVEVVTLVGGG